MGDVIFGTTRPTLKRLSTIDSNFDGQICSTGFCVLRPNTNKILTDFLYHLISSSDFFDYVEKTQKGASYPAISDAEVKKFRIPIPSLAIQEEIVTILNSFTELEAELEARRKQYGYYRNSLLDIKNIEHKAL
jgi:type I restriction enzyme S subunit